MNTIPAERLVLTAARLRGMVDAAAVTRRFSQVPTDLADELLLDFEAYGWVQRVEFAGTAGFSLTQAGHARVGELLRAELDAADARAIVEDGLARFEPLNRRTLAAMTDWQVRPTAWDRMAANDHSDWAWDEQVLRALAAVARDLAPVEADLAGALDRFAGYCARLRAALARVDQGQRRWVDEPGIESFHMVWFELHEDLLATLGRARNEA